MQTPIIAAESARGEASAEEYLLEAVPEEESADEDEAAAEAWNDETADDIPETGESVKAEETDSSLEEASDGAEEAVISFQATLDANGGIFENAWDDILAETVESTEILNIVCSAGEAVTVFPVYEKGNQTAIFLGWSLERDGDLVSQGYKASIVSGNTGRRGFHRERCLLF